MAEQRPLALGTLLTVLLALAALPCPSVAPFWRHFSNPLEFAHGHHPGQLVHNLHEEAKHAWYHNYDEARRHAEEHVPAVGPILRRLAEAADTGDPQLALKIGNDLTAPPLRLAEDAFKEALAVSALPQPAKEALSAVAEAENFMQTALWNTDPSVSNTFNAGVRAVRAGVFDLFPPAKAALAACWADGIRDAFVHAHKFAARLSDLKNGFADHQSAAEVRRYVTEPHWPGGPSHAVFHAFELRTESAGTFKRFTHAQPCATLMGVKAEVQPIRDVVVTSADIVHQLTIQMRETFVLAADAEEAWRELKDFAGGSVVDLVKAHVDEAARQMVENTMAMLVRRAATAVLAGA